MSEKIRDIVKKFDEHQLCAMTLYGAGLIEQDATVENGDFYFENVVKGDCTACPCVNFCLGARYNEI